LALEGQNAMPIARRQQENRTTHRRRFANSLLEAWCWFGMPTLHGIITAVASGKASRKTVGVPEFLRGSLDSCNTLPNFPLSHGAVDNYIM
jgi:hypothetical protein